jgi:hypothetical protein
MSQDQRERIAAAFERELASSPLPPGLRAEAVRETFGNRHELAPQRQPWALALVAVLLAVAIVAAIVLGTRAFQPVLVKPVVSPTPTQVSPTPTPTPAPSGGSASVKCSGGPGTAMAVVAGQFLYEVSDPNHPRLVCRGTNTYFHLLDGNAIAYTTVAAKKVYIVRRDLATGVESEIAELRADPNVTTMGWTSDGSLQVFTSYVPRANGRWLEQVHLWSNGADHVLYTFDAGPGGFAGRWSAHVILEFSPDLAYLAISDTNYSPQNYNVRIFSVTDLSQRLVTGTQGLAAGGGTWIANDHFVWAAGAGTLMQWTPTTGAKLLRSERWFTPTSSSDGRWLAGTLLTDTSKPHVLIVPAGGGQTFKTGLGSSPGFVTPTVVWYAEERTGASVPDGTIHAFDVTNGSDQVVRFRVGEKPTIPNGLTVCCSPRG